MHLPLALHIRSSIQTFVRVEHRAVHKRSRFLNGNVDLACLPEGVLS